MKLSIIIPTYNASATIERTLNSIYEQNLPQDDFEVIIVDDCSTDDTVKVIEDMKTLDVRKSNMVILCQPTNRKQGAARNRALKVAQGEYVTFVDSDDVVESGLPLAIENAIKGKPDMLICHYNRINEKGLKSEWKLKNEPINRVDGREFMEHHYDWFFVGAPWGYLLRLDYIKRLDIPFAEDVFTEDVDWITQHLYYADKIDQCQHVIYCNNYCEGSSSTGTRNWFRTACIILEAYRELLWAEKLRSSDVRMYEWLRDVASYKITYNMVRLWKLEGREYRKFYDKLGDDTIRSLSKIYPWSIRVKIMFEYPRLSAFVLSIVGAPLQKLKKIRL